MQYNDIMGTIGVGLILMAFFLSTARFILHNGKLYYVMNAIGAALACYASFLINYAPFVVLEGAWTIVSVYGLMRTMMIKIN